MIAIHQNIDDISAFSVSTHLILGWIPGATAWVKNALDNHDLNYHFTSEEMLLRSVLNGLYSTETFTLKNCGFAAAPEYLKTLSGKQLQLLDTVINQNMTPLRQTNLNTLIKEQQLCSQQDIIHVNQWLTTLKLNTDTRFQQLSLADLLTLRTAAAMPASVQTTNAHITTACDFALNYAITPRAFGLFFQYAYQVLSTLMQSLQITTLSTQVENALNDIHQQLEPLAMARLSCPQLTPTQTTNDVGDVIKNWGRNAQSIGFTDLPTALCQLANNLPLTLNTTKESLNTAAKTFDTTCQQFATNAKITSTQLSQDAQNWHYTLQNDHHTATFVLAEDGCISLTEFATQPQGTT